MRVGLLKVVNERDSYRFINDELPISIILSKINLFVFILLGITKSIGILAWGKTHQEDVIVGGSSKIIGRDIAKSKKKLSN